MANVALVGGTVITNSRRFRANVLLQGGRVAGFTLDTHFSTDIDVYDVTGFLIMPGAIDPHTHLGNQGNERLSQLILQESRDAIVGGVTTLSTTTALGERSLLEYLHGAREAVRSQSWTDYTLTLSPMTRSHIGEISLAVSQGARAFKFFLGYKGDEAVYFGMPSSGITLDMFYEGVAAIKTAGHGSYPMIHAEEPYLSEAIKSRTPFREENALEWWNNSYPGISEAIDIFKAAMVTRHVGITLYVVHTSSSEGLDTVRYLKHNGFDIVAETCPHYLIRSLLDPLGVRGKVKPPLRRPEDQRNLWQGVRQGLLTVLGTDTVPYTIEQKGPEAEFVSAPVGLGSSTAILLPLMFTEGVREGRLSLEQMVGLVSTNAARALGVYPQKGSLEIGSDADVVVFDPDAEYVVPEHIGGSDFNVYSGMVLRGFPKMTFLRGQLVARDGAVVGSLNGQEVPQ